MSEQGEKSTMGRYEVLLKDTEEALRCIQKENGDLLSENKKLKKENERLAREKESWRSQYEMICHSRGYRLILRLKALLGKL